MNLLLIGNGKWAQRYKSTLAVFKNITLKIANRTNWRQLIDEQPGGVIVCTPPDSHVEIASYALERNIPTLIEKPLALTAQEAGELLHFDQKNILVNHSHLFSPAYEELKRRVSKIHTIRSFNQNAGPFRNYSSLLDYGCHEIAAAVDLIGNNPTKRDCKRDRNLYTINLQFEHATASLSVGNGSKERVRYFEVNSQYVYADDLIWEGNVFKSEITPLENIITVFINIINGATDPRCGVMLAVDVLEIIDEMERVNISLPQHKVESSKENYGNY